MILSFLQAAMNRRYGCFVWGGGKKDIHTCRVKISRPWKVLRLFVGFHCVIHGGVATLEIG